MTAQQAPDNSSDFAAATDKNISEDIYRTITLRIVPFLFLAYVLCNIDRMNVGFAALDFEKDLGFGPAVYGLGASLFFIGYSLFELPSNLLLERIGARKTFMRIMILWGLASAAHAFVKTSEQFYLVRVALGAAEAGFLPGAIYYLSQWFPSNRRARIQSLFYIGMPVAGVIGSPISGLIMHSFGDSTLLKGWQWMFILEAIPTIVLGLYAFAALPDNPQAARWLSVKQRQIVVADLLEDKKTLRRGAKKSSLRAAIKEPIVWVTAFTYFCLLCTSSALTFWMPSVIRSFGFSDPLRIGALSAAPALAMLVNMIFLSRHSDRRGERRWHLSVSLLLGGVCLVGLGIFREDVFLSMALLTMASGFIAGSYPVFWSIPSTLLSQDVRAAGLGLAGGIGSVGGLLGSSVFGLARAHFGSFDVGLYFIAAVISIGALATLLLVPRENNTCNDALG
ncbi:MFS transporter [Burkholderia diffusa]|uniref:MFS transporter n=1 Tax=Burkholderia diffusa TaxID=488732 RepID=UPI000ADD5A89|nr:MFS transporter [Burkholderia diffusa]